MQMNIKALLDELFKKAKMRWGLTIKQHWLKGKGSNCDHYSAPSWTMV